jgi:hypothetical protein
LADAASFEEVLKMTPGQLAARVLPFARIAAKTA